MTYERWLEVRRSLGLPTDLPGMRARYEQEQERVKVEVDRHAWERKWLRKEEGRL